MCSKVLYVYKHQDAPKTRIKCGLQARQDLWSSLSSGARAQFQWPNPGEERVADESVFEADGPAADTPAMDTFGMVVISVDEVDYVSYRSMMRIRYKEQDGAWSECPVNT